MSTASFKGGLSPGGPSFAEKAKLQMRRPTPDSDAVASSDDDHDHGPSAPRPTTAAYPGARRPSSGWLQDIQPARKFSLPSVSLTASQPTTPSLELPQQARPNTSSFPWNTTSFTSNQSGSRLKEVLPSPTSLHPSADKALPSPTTVEADDGIGFLLNQQNPVRKSVRSQSYSVGQQDIENSAIGQFSTRLRSSIRHRPSKPSLLGDSSGLSQLREDDVDEVESSNGSEQGVRLPAGYWEREKQAQLKQQAIENARRNRATSTGSPLSQQRRKTTQSLRALSELGSDLAIEDFEEMNESMGPKLYLTRRFSEHAPALTDNLGRRHSFAATATYGSYNQGHQGSTLPPYEEDEEIDPATQPSVSPAPEAFDVASYFNGHGPASRTIHASAISAAHPDPIIPQPLNLSGNSYTNPAVLGRPGRRLFVVAFKCSRADIYYLYDNTGLEIRRGDLVITEGDRGCDLGQVTHADITLEEAKKYKAEAVEEHFRWLAMFSQYSMAGASSDSNMLGALARATGYPNTSNATIAGMGVQQDQDAKPKMIKRLAQQHEIQSLRDKEGQEAKAKRVGALKAAEHRLPMEILDAEYQADYHKLTYFYYAEAYVNFNDLVADLFKNYKVRIWMSAVNPASVVNPAGLMQIPPPSAIGPGAILHSRPHNSSLPVGPGFGNSSYRSREQYGRHGPVSQQHYDESYYPFAHQIAPYTTQPQFNVPQWGGLTTYPVYPNVTASGSPMNYGAYYPPTTAYSNAPAYPRYTPTTSGTAYGPSSAANTSTAGPSYHSSGYRTAGNYTAATSAYDPTLLAALQNLGVGN